MPEMISDPNVPNSAPVTNADPGSVFVEYTTPEGRVEKVTLQEAQARLATYSGKAAAFDKTAAEKAALEAKLADESKTAQSYRHQQELTKKAEAGDLDAFRELGSMMGLPEEYIESQIAEFQARQNPPPKGEAPGLSGDDRALLQWARNLRREYEAAGLDPVQDVLSARQFQADTTESWAKDATKEYLLKNDPILGKMVQHPQHGPKVFEQVWKRVNSAIRDGKQKFTPDTILKATEDIRGFADAFDAVFPASQPILDPGSLGSAPTLSASRLTPPKKPDLKDYGRSSENFYEYMRDLARYEQATRDR